MRQLLPTRARVGLERLEQVIEDVTTALRSPKRPTSRVGPSRTPRSPVDPDPFPEQVPPTRDGAEPGPPEISEDAQTSHRVVFEHLGEEVIVGPDESILDAGRAAGLDLAFSCTVGGCAACALQIVEGEVVYDIPTCLTDEERESGMCLACVGRPDGELILTERF
ncbi:MAG: 2Fe-2S iron-sulfur cluster-binding protein [Myxococcota bacterium]